MLILPMHPILPSLLYTLPSLTLARSMSGLHHPAPHHPPSNLLQAALLSGKLASPRQPPPHDNDDDYASEDETDSVVGVETPGRALSPASSAGRKERVDLGVSGRSTDPLRAFPNDIGAFSELAGWSVLPSNLVETDSINRDSLAGIQIFARLDFKSLARCARVSKRWNKSQTINYSASLSAPAFSSHNAPSYLPFRSPMSPPARNTVHSSSLPCAPSCKLLSALG